MQTVAAMGSQVGMACHVGCNEAILGDKSRDLAHSSCFCMWQVIRLALTMRKKALGFISSVGIMAGISHPEPVLESEDALSLCSEHAGDGAYAMG
jgi:thioester reductase-like protein